MRKSSYFANKWFSMDILFIGHSLIEFFDWQKKFSAHRVANLGVAGETVEGLLARIDKIIKECSSVDLIFIMTGLNNVAMEDFDFFDSYKKILERLSTAYPSARIFIHSLLPTTVDFIPDESIRNVNDSLKYLLRDTKVEFLDVYKLFVNRAGRPVKDYLLDDGVHLSDKGYAVWSKALEEIINNIKLSHQHPA
ncbi:MAG TPA: GDSL family lipase [Nitrospirae bacterium]|nr:GDSL family lipase [Nitrospirota bacterium]HDZ01097.1 GDSL family lipase [Nitrospirota bacterium]